MTYDFAELGPSHRKVVSLVPSASDVLEFGCATGYMTRALQQLDCRVTVVEIDGQALAQAVPYAHRALRADLNTSEDLPITEYFDRVIYADVLEHLLEPGRVLERSRRFLKPGGAVLLSIPNVAFWEIRKELLLGRFDYTERGILDRSHLHFYTETSLRKFVHESGYDLRELHHIFDKMPFDALFPGKLIALKRKLDGVSFRLLPRLFTYQFVALLTPKHA